jgi:hypothetical protein
MTTTLHLTTLSPNQQDEDEEWDEEEEDEEENEEWEEADDFEDDEEWEEAGAGQTACRSARRVRDSFSHGLT